MTSCYRWGNWRTKRLINLANSQILGSGYFLPGYWHRYSAGTEQPLYCRDASWYPSTITLLSLLPAFIPSLTPGNRSIICSPFLQFGYFKTLSNGNMKYVISWDWLFSTILCISSRPLGELIVHPYLLLSTIPWYICITVCLAIHQLMDIWVVSSWSYCE